MSDQLNFLGEKDGAVRYKSYYMMDVEISSSRKLFNVISTFSGGGGSSIGYKLAGGEVVVANEFVEEAAKPYLANSPKTKMLTKDIKELTDGHQFPEVKSSQNIIICLCPNPFRNFLDSVSHQDYFIDNVHSQNTRRLFSPALMRSVVESIIIQ